MYNHPPDNFLYSAYRILTVHSDGQKRIEGTATGFVLALKNGMPFLITNRHVIDKNFGRADTKYKDFKLCEISVTSRSQDDIEYKISFDLNSEFYTHNNDLNDVVMIRPFIKAGENYTFHFHFTIEHLGTKNIFTEIQAYDLICFAGFPQTHDKLMGRPILRRGTISSDPKYNYSWDKTNHGDCIAYDGFSSEGASGSPIFAPPRGMNGMINSRHGYLIGVNAGHVPENFGHSGISYFYKSTVIEEIIEQNNLEALASL